MARPKTYLITCRYCGDKYKPKQMTAVPKNKELLARWIQILGPKFEEGIRPFKTNFLCMAHFNMPDGARRREAHMLPFRMEEEEEDEPEIDEPSQQSVEMVPPTKTENTGVTEPMEEDTSSISTVQFEMEVSRTEEPNQQFVTIGRTKCEIRDDDIIEVVDENYHPRELVYPSHPPITRCRYCGIEDSQKMMTEVPKNAKKLHTWIDYLGLPMLENISQNPPPHFICLIHLKTILDKYPD